MVSLRKATTFATVLGAVVAVAGCGSSSSKSSSSTPASPPASSSGGAGSAAGGSTSLVISTAKASPGIYLTGASGRALYLFVADVSGKSNCSGACISTWPPLIAKGGMPSASGGVKAADLGTITRSDGNKQVTYMGHPLYYYSADTSRGQITGQGSNLFGAKWWLVAPSGSAITRSGSSAGASSSSGSSSGSYGKSSSSGASSSGASSSGGSSSGGGWG
jgi:predicted lipoprotein with Yx(FWY)xxD motif